MANASILPVLWPAVKTLINVTAITSLGYSVFDRFPVTPRPKQYVAMASPTETPLRAMGNLGSDTTFQLHIFSDKHAHYGPGGVHTVLSALIAILEPASLSLSGFTPHGVLYENSFDAGSEDENGVRYTHHVAVFRVYAKAA